MEITPELLSEIYHKEELNLMWISGVQDVVNSDKRLETLEHTSHYITDVKGFWGYRDPGSETTKYHKYELPNEFIEGTPEYAEKQAISKRCSIASKSSWTKRKEAKAREAEEFAYRLAQDTGEEKQYLQIQHDLLEGFISDEEEIRKELQELADQNLIEVLDDLVFL